MLAIWHQSAFLGPSGPFYFDKAKNNRLRCCEQEFCVELETEQEQQCILAVNVYKWYRCKKF